MNISQLETLLTISKTMSFRKAGELLNLTQPAVSAQIKSLEDEFKTILINRNQPVTLTEHGQVFGACGASSFDRGRTEAEAFRYEPYAARTHITRNYGFNSDSDFTARAILFSKPISFY